MAAKTPLDFQQIMTRYGKDVAFVAEEKPATTPEGFIEQLQTAAHRLDVYAGLTGAEDLDTAVPYLIDALASTGRERRTLLTRADKYLAITGDIVDDYRLMV